MTDLSRPPGYSDDDASEERASFGARLGGFLIDGVVISVVGYLGALALGYNALSEADPPLQSRFGSWLLWQWIGGLAVILYYAVQEGTWGQTIGKRVVNVRVVDFYRGEPIGFWRALWRLVAHLPSNFVCYLGYLWMLWDEEQQTWHDKLAGTVVVTTQ